MRSQSNRRWVRGMNTALLAALLWGGGHAALVAQVAAKHKSVSPTDQYGDPLPAGAVAVLGSQRLHPTGQIVSLAWSPDGKILATGNTGDDRSATVQLWDTTSGRAIGNKLTAANSAQITQIRFSPDSRTVIAYGFSGIAKWDVKSGKQTLLQIETGLVSPDGKTTIRRAGSRSKLTIRDTATKAILANIEVSGHTNGIQAIAYSPTQPLLATGTYDGQLHLWESRTGKKRFKLPISKNMVAKVAFTPDGKILAAGGYLPGILLFDTATGKSIRTLTMPGRSQATNTFAISADGKWVAATGRYDSSVHVHAIGDGKLRRTIVTDVRDIKHVAFSSDGSKIAVAGGDSFRGGSKLSLWDVAGGKQLLVNPEHTAPISQLVFSPEGDLIATMGATAIRLWKAKTGRHVVKLSAAGMSTLAFSADGWSLGAAGPYGGYKVWEVSTADELIAVARDSIRALSANVFALSPQLDVLAVGTRDGKVQLYDAPTQKLLRTITVANRSEVNGIAFAPDGKTFLATAEPRFGRGKSTPVIAIFDTGTGKPLRQLSIPAILNAREQLQLRNVIYSPDGQTIAGVCSQGVYVWDAGGVGGPIQIPAAADSSIVYSSDGKTLVIAPGARSRRFPRTRVFQQKPAETIRLIEVATGMTYHSLPEKKHGITAIALSPRGDRLATAFAELNNVAVWNVRPPQVKTVDNVALKSAWNALRSRNVKAAYNAKWVLIAAGDRSLKPIQSAFASAGKEVPRKQILELIGQLGDRKFPVRQKATNDLMAIGAKAVPELRIALAKQPELEVKRRIEALIRLLSGALQKLPGEPLRRIRAIEVLERIDSEQSIQLLQQIAKGPSKTRESIDAKAALGRIENLKRGR